MENPDRVDVLFNEYRMRYRTLKSMYVKKNRPLTIYSDSIVVKGQKMFSRALLLEAFDLTMHNCGLNAYPKHLEPNNTYKNHWTFDCRLSEIQKDTLKEYFEKLDFDLNLYKESIAEAKGFWLNYINEIFRLKKEWGGNLTGQIGDILFRITSNFLEILELTSNDSRFKSIDGYTSKIEIRSIISDKLFECFVNSNYQCEHFESRKCYICKDEFLPQQSSEWVGRVPAEFCHICIEMGFSSSTEFFRQLDFKPEIHKSNLIFGIQTFTEHFGFIPSANTQKRRIISQLYQSKMDLEEITKSIKVASLLPYIESVKSEYKSWAHLLEEAGLLSQRQRGRGGHQSIASDGHLCLSLGERAICEYLLRNGYQHEKEPMYPTDPVLNPKGLLRADFVINGIFVEFAGMMNNIEYAENLKNKMKLAKKANIKWFALESYALEDLAKLQDFLDKP